MTPTIKLAIAFLGILIGAIQTPLWLTLFMLALISGLFTESCLKTVIFLKRKQMRAKRLYRFYERKRKRSDWVSKTSDLPMIQYKNYKW